MARRKRHALAEYGEPFGDIGFMSDFLDKKTWLDFAKVAGAGLLTASIVPKGINYLAKFLPASVGKYVPIVKGIGGIAGGFALYKYAGRRVPAKWRDAIVASSGVMAGLGVATIAHELVDKSTTIKGLHGLGDLFPVNLANVGPSEDQMLAALQNVEDQLAADMDGDFGDVFTLDASVEEQMFDIPRPGFSADVDPEQSWALQDAEGFGELDASVTPQDALDFGEEVDLDALQLFGL